MNLSKLFNNNRCLVVLLWSILSHSLEASSQNISEKNPFLSPAAQELKKELDEQKNLKIYFSGNLAGSRESCGCALNPKGGLERHYNFLKKEGLLEKKRPDNTLVLDFGNLLFKNENITLYEKKAALDNAQKMIQAANFFQYDAVNFGNLDRSLPLKDLTQILEDSRFPWLSSNISASERFHSNFKKHLSIKLKDIEILLLGLSSIEGETLPNGLQLEDPQKVLTHELQNIPEHVLPVILSDLDLKQLTKVASSLKRPVIFLGSREMGGWERPLELGTSLLLHIRHQGQEWGVLKVPTQLKNRSSWYNTSETSNFAKRWEDLKKDKISLNDLSSSSEKTIEIKNIETKAQELKELAPSSKRDIPFYFETIEMNSTFKGKNSVSKYMK